MPLAVLFTFLNTTLPFMPVLYVVVAMLRGVGTDGKLNKAFSFFFVNFRKGTRWWQVVALMKDLSLLCIVLIFTDPFLQFTLMAGILSCYLVAALYIRPFRKTSTLRLELTLIILVIAVMIIIGGGFSSSLLTDDEVSVRTVVSLLFLVPALIFPAVFVLLFCLMTIAPKKIKKKMRKCTCGRVFLNALGFRDEERDSQRVREDLGMVRIEPSDINELVGRMDEVERLGIHRSMKMLGHLASNGDKPGLLFRKVGQDAMPLKHNDLILMSIDV